MAKANVDVKVSISLELTVKEAEMIKSLTQNYLNGDEETQEHSDMRQSVFNTLKQALNTKVNTVS